MNYKKLRNRTLLCAVLGWVAFFWATVVVALIQMIP